MRKLNLESQKRTGTSFPPRKSRTLLPRSLKTGKTTPPSMTQKTRNQKIGTSPNTSQTQMPPNQKIGTMRWTENGNPLRSITLNTKENGNRNRSTTPNTRFVNPQHTTPLLKVSCRLRRILFKVTVGTQHRKIVTYVSSASPTAKLKMLLMIL